jgi:hypothetical protein
MADADIFCGNKLLLTDKPLMKTEPLCPKNHPWKTVLRLTLKSSLYIDYCSLRNRWRKLGPCDPKNNPRSPVLRLTLKSSLYMDYCWLRNRWPKLGLPDPKNNPRSPVLRLTLTSSAEINYSWQTNRWWKLSPCVPKIILEKQFYGWRWNLHSTWTTAGSETVDEN